MKTVKKKVKAFIFDMDGTIIQSEHIWGKATHMVLKKKGFAQFSPEQEKALQSLSGLGMEESWTFLKKHFELNEHIHDLSAEVHAHAQDIFSQGVAFVEGFEQFHKTIQEHEFPSAIATNASLDALLHLSKIMNFESFFGNKLYSKSHVNNKAKPDPALFLHVAEQLKVSPHECVVFEDSIHGINAAHAAGMKCIAIEHDENHEHRHKAHHSIPTYDHALTALKKIIEDS